MTFELCRLLLTAMKSNCKTKVCKIHTWSYQDFSEIKWTSSHGLDKTSAHQFVVLKSQSPEEFTLISLPLICVRLKRF